MRTATAERNTAETKIRLSLNLDGTGLADVQSGCGFLDHMLTLFAAHGRFDLTLRCEGDTQVDDHHSVEDIGILLGKAFTEALVSKKGIYRYADITLPMDEALIACAVDVSGRSYLAYSLEIPTQKVGSFDTELVEEFFRAFVSNFPIALHLRRLAGSNSHHIIEGAFKAVARVLRKALAIDPEAADSLPSTKGVL